MDISGDLEIGNGSTITVVANDGVNGDGTPTAKEGRYELIKYTGSRVGGFFTNKTDLTTIFNVPSLRPAWFDDTVSKVIGITMKQKIGYTITMIYCDASALHKPTRITMRLLLRILREWVMTGRLSCYGMDYTHPNLLC